jgi:hypothetical protein
LLITRIPFADEGGFGLAVDILHFVAVNVLGGLGVEGGVRDAAAARVRDREHVVRRRL